MAKPPKANRYQALIESIFFDNYKTGLTEFEFARTDIEAKAQQLDIVLPRNLGDIAGYAPRPIQVLVQGKPSMSTKVRSSCDALPNNTPPPV